MNKKTKELTMNKLTKIGLTALAGSLATVAGAQAGAISVGGGADITWTKEQSNSSSSGQSVTGNPLGWKNNLTFSYGGELDNGISWSANAYNSDAQALTSSNITFDLAGMGTLVIDNGAGGMGLDALDDKMPSAWEEADGAGLGAGINKIAGTSAGGTIEVTPSAYTPDGLTVRFAFAQDADSGNTNDKTAGGSSGVLGSGWDLTLEASSDLTGVDGLTLYGGMSNVEQYQNASTYDGDVKETVYGFKYAVGGFTFGAQTSDEDTGATATASYDNVAYGITFQINDDLSVSYGHTESDNGATTAEADSIQASYTMGGATISIAEVEVNNATYSTASTADKDATIISLGLAF